MNINWLKNWYSQKQLDSPDFSFISEWGKYQYSFIICISDEFKRSVGKDKHDLLIFSCSKSIEIHSDLVKNNKANIIIANPLDSIEFKQAVFIDEYILFLHNPDHLILSNQLYSNSLKYFNQEWALRFIYGPLMFKYDEKIYQEYEKIVGNEIAEKLFFKTQEKLFNSLQNGTKFVYSGNIYEKVPLVNSGCCSPSFNCINEYNCDDLLYLNNSVVVEKIL